jgi:hypothetical protein
MEKIKMAKSNGILKSTAKTSTKSTKKVVAPKFNMAQLTKTILQLVKSKQGFYDKAKIVKTTKANRSAVKAAIHTMWGKSITKKRKNGSYVGAYFLKTQTKN